MTSRPVRAASWMARQTARLRVAGGDARRLLAPDHAAEVVELALVGVVRHEGDALALQGRVPAALGTGALDMAPQLEVGQRERSRGPGDQAVVRRLQWVGRIL